MKTAMLIVLVSAAVAGCRGRAVEPLDTGGVQHMAAAGDTVTLRVGDAVVIRSSGLRLLLRSVSDDSRCPTDVNCVWAGDAVVHLDYSRSSAADSRLELHIHSEPREAQLEGVRVRLLEIAPEKHSGKGIRPQEYSVRLSITSS